MKNRLLIIYPYSNIHTNPTMYNLVHTLVETWECIDIFCTNGDIYLRNGHADDISLTPIKPQSSLNPLKIGGSFVPRNIHRLKALLSRADLSIRRSRYSAVIGVDPTGITLAHELSRRVKRPLIYLSFEIMYRDEVDQGPNLKIKMKELNACKDVSLVLIQDEERGKELAEENRLSLDKMVFVPNSPAPTSIEKSNFLRGLLDISSEKKIVLYAGSLHAWASRDFLDEMVYYWPEDYCLVIHNRLDSEPGLKMYMERLKKTGKIFISPEPLPMEKLTMLYSSADFGLAPYKPTPESWFAGKNIYHLGLSSGKIAYYAMCGLPILASNLPVFEKEFARFHCGITYSRLSETGDILTLLDRDYESFRRGSIRFYQERLNPVESIKQFCNRLLEIGYA